MEKKNYQPNADDLKMYDDWFDERYEVEILDDVCSIKRMCGFIFLSLLVFTILMIIYAALTMKGNGLVNATEISTANVLLVIGFIVLFINFIINIMIIVKSAKINSSGYTKIYGELSSFLILSIIGLFIFGTIISIVMFIVSKNVIRKIEYDIAEDKFESNPETILSNKPTQVNNYIQQPQPKRSKKERLQEALELKQSGLIDENEYKKMKEKIILSDD